MVVQAVRFCPKCKRSLETIYIYIKMDALVSTLIIPKGYCFRCKGKVELTSKEIRDLSGGAE